VGLGHRAGCRRRTLIPGGVGRRVGSPHRAQPAFS
jgi:hypothetical protein